MSAIEVRGLRKTYGDLEAVRGIDLSVEHGEVFAFLGPNGAGKTTTVEILEGYRERSDGELSVLGVDPASPTRAWRERVGIVLQTCEVQPAFTVREAMELYAGYYPEPRDVGETLELVGLTEQSGQRARRLSGGQQRRLDVALALVGDPELLFLDEPTTGFDPSARRDAWTMIAGLRELGKTVFLTTHYMDEAEAVADRAAVIVDGRIVAEGAPADLGGRAEAPTTIRFRVPVGSLQLIQRPGETIVTDDGNQFTVQTKEPTSALHAITGAALDQKVELDALEVERPSLEDIYLSLTDEQPG